MVSEQERFHSDLIIAVEDLLGADADAGPPASYREMLYQEWVAAQRPPVQAWLSERLRKVYVSLSQPPRWVDYPVWPFIDGTPTAFLGQIDCGDVVLPTGETLSSGSAYVFVGAVRTPTGGWKSEFRVVRQSHATRTKRSPRKR